MYAQVLLPLPLQSTFTYSVPPEMTEQVKPGHRVIVPFGRRKFYTGIVTALDPRAPSGFEAKPIEQVLDTAPVLAYPQYKFWEWIANYYLCSVGDVYKAAVPSGLRLESETYVEIAPDYEENPEQRLSERELLIVARLQHEAKRMSLSDLDRAMGFSRVPQTVSGLLDKGAVIISERLVERYHARKEVYVEIAADRGDSEALHRAFSTIAGAKKQELAYMTLLELSAFMRRTSPLKEVTRRALMESAGVTSAIVGALAKRGLVRLVTKVVSRFDPVGGVTAQLPALSDAQNAAYSAIDKSWADHDITLLHGVTSSGKTEVYIHLINDALTQQRQVLYLVPEIALTTQLTRRLQNVFGDRVVIYHSKFSDNERVDIWRRMLIDRRPCVVIGARSSVFLPFAKLGLIIIDEEHETSFKQQDPAPRYNARDTALVLAQMHGAKSLLGSATPAIDTYYKAQSGRYGLVELTERYGGVALPDIRLIDLSRARKRGEVSGAISLELRRMVNEAVLRGDQAILFINRRGFAPYAQCKMCGFVPKCDHCDVALTYHRHADKLVCHYCGTPYALPPLCPQCKEAPLEILGYGTERVEDDVAQLFPDAKLMRMDLDTTRNKDAYEKIIEDFSNRRAQILVGTQMVTKGLDFEGVSVVGVVKADSIVNLPDFRAGERAFNMLSQVAGRAGRRADTPGLVAIQTYSPQHPLYQHLINHDYAGFYADAIEERRLYNYPPFTRLIYVYIRHSDRSRANTLAASYAAHLRQLFGNRVQGPDDPAVARVQSLYIKRIMLKIETEASMRRVKEILRGVYEEMAQARALSGAIIHYDVDPM